MPGPYAFDPELVPFAEIVPRQQEPLDHRPAAAVEERLRTTQTLESIGYSVADHTGLLVEDFSIAGHSGAPSVPLRVYRSKGLPPGGPCVIFIHGGGFVQGSIFEGPSSAASTAQRLPFVCVDVEYRLAPEHAAPAAIEDSYAALSWVAANAENLGIDADRIIVSGGSAGGGIAAGLSLMVRDIGGPRISFLVLVVPELDDRLETASMREFTDTPMFSRAAARRSWDWYLGGEHSPQTSPFAVPGRRTDLMDLPPTYISVAHFDPLRDEGIAYASRLLECGVTVELHLFPGTFHGSALATHAEVTRREAAEMDAVLCKAAGLARPK